MVTVENLDKMKLLVFEYQKDKYKKVNYKKC